MATDVADRIAQCLQCVKASNGQMVPRPFGTQLIPEYAGEIHMMDYIKVWPSKNGRSYALMQADKMSKLAKFTATEQTTAVPACQAMLWWGSQFGLPEWLISDGGTHFANDVMKLLTGKMKVKHHVTLAFFPWANGSIEVMGRELVRTIMVMLSE